MMKLFNIKQYGYLYIDQIIFESYYPILFTLKNDNDDLFLCVCHQYDYEGQKWLLTRTTPETVIEMLSDKIYLRDAFLKYDDLQVSIELDKDGEFQYHYDIKEDWDRDNSVVLPDPEEYLDVEPHEFDRILFI